MVEEVLVHKAMIALRVILGEPHVFIQIERSRLREVQSDRLIQPYEVLIQLDRRAARCKPEHRVWFDPELPRDDLRGLLAHLLVGIGKNDTHCDTPFYRICPEFSYNIAQFKI